MTMNSDYQRQLAESLIDALGVDGAFECAAQNLWDGVLVHIPNPYEATGSDRFGAATSGDSHGRRPL